MIEAQLQQTLTLSAEQRQNLRRLKDSYSNIAANTINYIATMAEGYMLGQTETINATRAETHLNLLTATREHQLARALGKDSYHLNWHQTSDGPKLFSQFGYLDDLFQETSNSAQLAGFEFEVPRNEQNAEFYKKLKTARASGYTGPMVEFSPRPEMTEAARARGYEGHDTILIYRNTGDREIIEQLWFEGAASWNDYRPLLEHLQTVQGSRSDLPEYNSADSLQTLPQNLTDVDIMKCSGRFTSQALDNILSFCDTRELDTLPPDQALQLRDFVLEDVQEKIATEIMPVVEAEAARVAAGNFNISTETLTWIADEIRRQQYRIERFKQELQGQGSLREFDLLTDTEQSREMQDANFELNGCGFSYSANRQNFANQGFINTDAVDAAAIIRLDDEVICPSCGWCFRVKNGDPSTYESSCPSPAACPDRSKVRC